MEPGFFQWCPVTGQKAVGPTETQESPSKHQETLVHCEGDQAQTQVAGRAGGVSIFEDIRKLSGYGHGQLGLGGPALAKELDQMTSGGPCQPHPFCDYVIL